jgi:hypothetical protein
MLEEPFIRLDNNGRGWWRAISWRYLEMDVMEHDTETGEKNLSASGAENGSLDHIDDPDDYNGKPS